MSEQSDHPTVPAAGRTNRRVWLPGRRLLRVGLGGALAALLLLATPPVRAAVKGTLVVLDVLPTPVSPLAVVTPEPRRSPVSLPSAEADVYRPRGFSEPAGVVLVHGANPGGKDDPRVVDLATAIARAGRTVLVPNLGLRRERLDPLDADRIAESVAHLADEGEVAIVAFSFGAALSLLALADQPELQRDVRVVATVGTYFDLTNLLTGVTTGRAPYRDELVDWEPHPDALGVLAEQLAGFIGGREGDRLRRAWRQQEPEDLGPVGAQAYALLTNRDPARVEELTSRFPGELQELLVELSPSSVVDRVDVPVYALHDASDPAAPVTESRLLVEALEHRVDTRLVEVDMFDHVFPVAGPLVSIPDALRVTAYVAAVLRTQEGWPRL